MTGQFLLGYQKDAMGGFRYFELWHFNDGDYPLKLGTGKTPAELAANYAGRTSWGRNICLRQNGSVMPVFPASRENPRGAMLEPAADTDISALVAEILKLPDLETGRA